MARPPDVSGDSERRALPGWRGLLVVIAVACIAAFYAGTQFVYVAPPTHPLTGRQIAGITSDAMWLDRDARAEEETPQRALELLGIGSGMVVADVGAGTGYMTIPIAQRVAPTGKVYANELQPAMLQIIADKAHAAHLSNVELVLGRENDAGLPAEAIDLALLIDVYHELAQPQAMLRSLWRSLKPGGALVLIEYRKEDPSIPIAETHRLSIAEARTEVEAEGFQFDRVIEGLPRQHIIVFRRPVQSSRETTSHWRATRERSVVRTVSAVLSSLVEARS